ncbi:hypothetical protein F5880DRAFT_1509478 [Lentinula raphanica]|nr:hypothetical protein F5880DRAFT_1509478 [Lentinula raphanica]
MSEVTTHIPYPASRHLHPATIQGGSAASLMLVALKIFQDIPCFEAWRAASERLSSKKLQVVSTTYVAGCVIFEANLPSFSWILSAKMKVEIRWSYKYYREKFADNNFKPEPLSMANTGNRSSKTKIIESHLDEGNTALIGLVLHGDTPIFYQLSLQPEDRVRGYCFSGMIEDGDEILKYGLDIGLFTPYETTMSGGSGTISLISRNHRLNSLTMLALPLTVAECKKISLSAEAQGHQAVTISLRNLCKWLLNLVGIWV